jgi:hypothetical protein
VSASASGPRLQRLPEACARRSSRRARSWPSESGIEIFSEIPKICVTRGFKKSMFFIATTLYPAGIRSHDP